jgi:hypothetical protein
VRYFSVVLVLFSNLRLPFCDFLAFLWGRVGVSGIPSSFMRLFFVRFTLWCMIIGGFALAKLG